MNDTTLYALHDELEKISARMFEQAGKWMKSKGAPALKRAAGKAVQAPGKAVNWMKAPVGGTRGPSYRVV